MASTEGRANYYTVLGVADTATMEEIKTSYRKLAKTLHPDKNPDNPDATASFQRLSEAYETLRDPRKRMEYDIKRIRVNEFQRNQQATENRGAGVAGNCRKPEAEKEKPESRDIKALKNLAKERADCRKSMGETRQRILKNIKILQDLQDQDEASHQESRASSNTWFQTLHGAPRKEDQEQQKQARETERLQRVARRRIIEHGIGQDKASLQTLENRLQDVIEKISGIENRLDEEARVQGMRERKRWTKETEPRAETHEQQARRERERWETWEEQILKAGEAARQEAQTDTRQAFREQARSAQEARRAWEMQDSFPSGSANFPTGSAAASQRAGCRHEKFWPRVGGPHLCRNCERLQTDFAFQCPGCHMIACANCRRNLRGERY